MIPEMSNLEKENLKLTEEVQKLKEELKRIRRSQTSEQQQKESNALYAEVIKILGEQSSIEYIGSNLCSLFVNILGADVAIIIEYDNSSVNKYIKFREGTGEKYNCPVCKAGSDLEIILGDNTMCLAGQILDNNSDAFPGVFSKKGSFFTGRFSNTLEKFKKNPPTRDLNIQCLSGQFESMIITPIQIAGETTGIIHLVSERQYFFSKTNLYDIENIAGSIANAFQRIRSKQQLKQFEEIYQGIIENIHDGIILLNSSGNMEYCNNVFSAWVGNSQAELKEVNWLTFVKEFVVTDTTNPDGLSYLHKELNNLFNDKNSNLLNENLTIKLKSKQGKILDLEQKIIRINIGNNDYFLVVFHDVTQLMEESRKLQNMASEMEATISRLQSSNEELILARRSSLNLLEDLNNEINERKAIEAELTKSKEYFKRLIENSRDIIAVVDPEGKKLYESESVELALGYKPAEMIGRYSSEFIHPNDIIKLQEPWKELLKNPRRSMEMTFSMRHKDGSYRIMEGTLMNLLDDPAVNGIIINYRDVTDKRAAEGLIRHTQSLLLSLLNNAPVMIFVISIDEKVEIVNRAWESFFNQKLEDIKGRHISAVLPQSIVEDFSETNRQVMHERKTIYYDRSIKTNKGIRHFNFFKWPVLIDGVLTSIGGMAVDVTQAKVASEKVLKLSRAIEQIPVSVIITDTNGTIEYVNPKFTQVSGYSYEEVIGKNPRILKSGAQDRFTYAALWETIKSGLTWTGELCNKRKNGELYWEQVTISPLKTDEGIITHFIAVKEDISEKRAMIKTLKDIRKRINFISEVTSSSLYYLKFADMNFEFIGPAITKITGYTQKELNKMGFDKIIKIVESRDNSNLSITSLYDNLDAVKDKEYKANYFIQTKDGNSRWLEEESYPWYDTNDVLIGRLGIIRDITTRKDSEEELLLEKLKLEQLINNSPVGIITLDGNNSILNVNEGFTKIFQYSREELIGKNPDELILPAEDIQKGREISTSVIKGNSIILEAYRKKKDGTLIFVRIIGLPIIVHGKVTGIYGLYDDLSDLKKAEEDMKIAKERAEEINRLKSTFLANMSHELRTPLVGILGFAEMLSDSTDEEARAHGEVIFTNGKRLLETLNLILDLSKLEAEKIKVEYEYADVNQVVAEVIKLFTPNAEKKRLYLKSNFDIDPLYADFDPNLLRDSITNLVNNAIKFTHTGGIVILTGLLGNNFFIRVKDTGIGIETEKFDLIFEEFRQASEGTSRIFEGTGLGLTITRNYIMKMNGKITVESELGKGTTFNIYLPISQSKK